MATPSFKLLEVANKVNCIQMGYLYIVINLHPEEPHWQIHPPNLFDNETL